VIARTWNAAAAGLGTGLFRAGVAAVGMGAAALAAALATGRAEVVRAALDASVLFLAGAAAGAVAVSAAVRLAHGAWAGALFPAAEAGVGFFRPALAVLAALSLGAAGGDSPEGGTAGHLARAAAPLAGALAAFATGARFVARVRAARDGSRVRAAAAACLAGLAIGFWVWAAGYALGTAPGSTVAVVPPASFVAAFLSGLAWVALVAAARGEAAPEALRDLARLLFALAALWAYLLWSLYLPSWYANVPEAAGFLLARWSGPYRPLAGGALGACCTALVLLFPARLARGGRRTLAAGAAAILLALWLERLLLVLPSRALAIDPASGLAAAGAALGLAGIFLLAVGPRLAGAVPLPSPAPPPLAPRLDVPPTDLASPNGG
jgi:hypothetical protein